MGDILRPYMLVVLPHPPTPSPPPPPATKSNSMAMLYYGLGVVGTAAVILLIYNILFIRWRDNDNSRRGVLQRRNPPPRVPMRRPLSVNSDNINLISSKFKYKKEGGGGGGGGGGGSSEKDELYECAVCLSVFEEGEELRQLPNCKHSFHAPCIDMWLYSHLDCPLCRSPVEPPVLCRSPLPPTVSAAPVGEQAVTSTRVQRFSRENFINYSVML